MAPIITLLVVLTFSLLVMRVATIALTLTGLSMESARFQARSAFTGVGFTTTESEGVVNHPVRRRILMLLMLMGNAGIAAVVASLIIGFVRTGGAADAFWRVVSLAVGLVALVLVARSPWVDRQLGTVIRWALARWTDLDVRDYANLLRLSDGYAVTEIQVEANDWLASKTLSEAALAAEGVLVLGIECTDGRYVKAPTGTSRVGPTDRVILYGNAQHLHELDLRPAGDAGDAAHQMGVERQAALLKQQAQTDAKEVGLSEPPRPSEKNPDPA